MEADGHQQPEGCEENRVVRGQPPPRERLCSACHGQVIPRARRGSIDSDGAACLSHDPFPRLGLISPLPRLGRENLPAMLATAVSMVLLAVLAVLFFDLRGEGPLSDEWMYQWSAGQLASGHLHIWPELSPLSLVQGGVAAAAFRLGAPLTIARFTEVPFLLMGFGATLMTGVRLGADRAWASVAAASVVLSPVLLFTATGLLSDAAYFGLMGLAILLAVRYLQTGRRLGLMIAAAILAGLQRQFGVGLLVAVGVVLLFRREDRQPVRGVLLALLGITLAAMLLFGPPALHISGGRIGELTAGLTPAQRAFTVLGLLFETGPMLGLVALPMALRLALAPPSAPPSRTALVPFALAVVGGCAAVFYALHGGGSVFPGPILNPHGLGALDRISPAGKASPYPSWFFSGFMILVTVASLVALGRCSRAWVRWDPRGSQPALLLLAASQVAPLVIVGTGDRYFLPVIAPLAPLLAVMASAGSSRWSGLSNGWAGIGLCFLLAVYVLGEGDFIAWHNARHHLAVAAYTKFPSLEPNLGEDGAFTYAIPGYEKTGRIVPIDAHPELLLEFAAVADPRPGLRYGPAPKGKVVVVCLRDFASCESRVRQLHLQ